MLPTLCSNGQGPTNVLLSRFETLGRANSAVLAMVEVEVGRYWPTSGRIRLGCLRRLYQ
jgi:hypothetical protein